MYKRQAEQRTLAELEQTYGHRQDVLPALVQECRDLYLLVDPSRNQPDQPPASRLTHDTLAPHVRKRFDESVAPGQQARRILESRAVEWRNDQSGPVLDGPDLAAVEAGRSGMRAWEEEKGEIRLFQASQLARRKRLRQRWVTFGTLASLALAVVLALSWDTLQDWRLQQEVIKASLQVDVGAFKLDRYEVSIALYAKCFRSDSQRCPKPESNEDFSRYSDGDKQLGDLPVTDVTAIQARAFCQWLGRRLPTYEEWIIAVRRWESEVIQVDDTLAISDQYNMGQSRSSLWPVNRVTADTQDGALRPLHLIGNAWEWTSDWYSTRHEPAGDCCGTATANPLGGTREASIDPNEPAAIPRKVLKGGSFLCAENYCSRYRPSSRIPESIESATCHISFRCIARP